MNWSNVHYQNQFVRYRDQETINVNDPRFEGNGERILSVRDLRDYSDRRYPPRKHKKKDKAKDNKKLLRELEVNLTTAKYVLVRTGNEKMHQYIDNQINFNGYATLSIPKRVLGVAKASDIACIFYQFNKVLWIAAKDPLSKTVTRSNGSVDIKISKLIKSNYSSSIISKWISIGQTESPNSVTTLYYIPINSQPKTTASQKAPEKAVDKRIQTDPKSNLQPKTRNQKRDDKTVSTKEEVEHHFIKIKKIEKPSIQKEPALQDHKGKNAKEYSELNEQSVKLSDKSSAVIINMNDLEFHNLQRLHKNGAIIFEGKINIADSFFNEGLLFIVLTNKATCFKILATMENTQFDENSGTFIFRIGIPASERIIPYSSISFERLVVSTDIQQGEYTIITN